MYPCWKEGERRVQQPESLQTTWSAFAPIAGGICTMYQDKNLGQILHDTYACSKAAASFDASSRSSIAEERDESTSSFLRFRGGGLTPVADNNRWKKVSQRRFQASGSRHLLQFEQIICETEGFLRKFEKRLCTSLVFLVLLDSCRLRSVLGRLVNKANPISPPAVCSSQLQLFEAVF